MKQPFFRLAIVIALGTLGSCNQSSSTHDTTAKDSGEVQTDTAAASNAVQVTADNFVRAETDVYFATSVKEAGGIGQFHHYTELMPIDNQTVIRANRDVLYSSIVLDLDAGPVTAILPDPGKGFMSMMSIDEDQYAETVYAPGTFTYTKDKVGTRYMMLAIRTFIDPNNEKDLDRVKALQAAIKIEQTNKGSFDIPNWDKDSQKKIHDSLVEVSKSLPDTKGMFGPRGQVDPVRHLIGSASAWGGNPEKDAMYLPVTPQHNDGKTIYTLKVKNVPVDGFWSISVYNKAGYFEKNDYNSYSINNVTAKKDADGSVTIQFGGCDGKIANCIPITDGWNYWVRLYRPRKEIQNGSWKFPEAKPKK
ncbi:DUF1214 domain-containing protein [Flavihumibacter petaseus]|uniref:DUF1254 domain-containing protein n=1 Tax=Flavihumibacter petaseus NBRC 106054 TaxID=1220578 RepID=A0A0E9N2N1_9BACT|nr:DUF1214 domain-containing protein [Flavihumibacter petaseus]GAO44058.1 hypothetical protein FPE01S_03_00980 [Flavihumibacter petaseus NBRC 106054]